MNLHNIMPSERIQILKVTYGTNPYEICRIDKSIETERRMVVAQDWGAGLESGASGQNRQVKTESLFLEQTSGWGDVC